MESVKVGDTLINGLVTGIENESVVGFLFIGPSNNARLFKVGDK